MEECVSVFGQDIFVDIRRPSSSTSSTGAVLFSRLTILVVFQQLALVGYRKSGMVTSAIYKVGALAEPSFWNRENVCV